MRKDEFKIKIQVMSYRSEAALLTLWYRQITLLSKEIISNIQQSHLALNEVNLNLLV